MEYVLKVTLPTAFCLCLWCICVCICMCDFNVICECVSMREKIYKPHGYVQLCLCVSGLCFLVPAMCSSVYPCIVFLFFVPVSPPLTCSQLLVLLIPLFSSPVSCYLVYPLVFKPCLPLCLCCILCAVWFDSRSLFLIPCLTSELRLKPF